MILHNNPANKLIKRRKREKRRTVYKLPYIWWLLGILFAALGLLVVSYFTYKCAPWFSGALVSLSCGCFTGATFYFLVNIRTNKEHKLQREYEAIKETYDLLESVFNYKDCYNQYRYQRDRHHLDDGAEFIFLLERLEQARSKIDLSIYDIVPDLGYDPLDRDNMNLYKSLIRTSENEKTIGENMKSICEEIAKAENELSKLLRIREDQLSFMRGKFL